MPLRELQAVLDAAADAVVVMDHAGRMLLANRATEGLFGWSAAELQGRSLDTLVPTSGFDPEAGHGAPPVTPVAAQLRVASSEVLARRRDGSGLRVRLSIGQVAGADPPQYVGYLHDLSEQLRQSEDARRLQERLLQVTRMATMGEMTSGIAHEINQPLTAIANYARAVERLLERPEPDLSEPREALREIAGEALRAAEIINRLRRMARGDEGQPELAHVPELIEELRVLCLADARACDARIRFELQPDLPPLLIHRVQIAQALLNLIRNALESLACDPPGAREIVVAGRRNAAGDCEIEVCDNGPGVAPEIRDRMFEPFRSTRPEGTGLGLPMSQTIVLAHGGSLRHEPAQPRGARFVLTMPAATRALSPAPAP